MWPQATTTLRVNNRQPLLYSEMDAENWFGESVLRVVPEYLEQLKPRCQDRYVGPLSKLRGHKDWSFAAAGDSATRSTGPCIILVMESPHKQEYSERCA